MKLKLEAEWHCSGTGKSSRLPACVCVCMLVMDGGVMRKGASKLFHLGGHSSANKTSNVIPPKTIPHTHTGTGRYPQRDKHAACPTQSSRKQQKAAESSRSSVSTLRSANASEATKKNISLTFNNFVLKQSAHRY